MGVIVLFLLSYLTLEKARDGTRRFGSVGVNLLLSVDMILGECWKIRIEEVKSDSSLRE